MDPRLAARINMARRNMRLKQGIGTPEDGESWRRGEVMTTFRDKVDQFLDLTTTCLLGIRFEWGHGGPVAFLEIDNIEFSVQSERDGFVLYGPAGRMLIGGLKADDPSTGDRILCAIGEYVELVTREPESASSM